MLDNGISKIKTRIIKNEPKDVLVDASILLVIVLSAAASLTFILTFAATDQNSHLGFTTRHRIIGV
jgi:hypothetical protein